MDCVGTLWCVLHFWDQSSDNAGAFWQKNSQDLKELRIFYGKNSFHACSVYGFKNIKQKSVLLATLTHSNMDKPDQHIIEQHATLFLTVPLSKLWESGSMILKVNLNVLLSHLSHKNTFEEFIIHCKIFGVEILFLYNIYVPVSCYFLLLLQPGPNCQHSRQVPWELKANSGVD